MKTTVATLFLAVGALASPLDTRQSVTNRAIVDLSTKRGTPQQLASGVLYGIPDVANTIPDQFYTGPKLKNFRAGGAQLFAVGQRGWNWNEYGPRFQSTLSNYKTARKYGANFQILPHDIWGTDTTNSSSVWPGDNGDWTNYEKFLDRLIADIKANNMIPGLRLDLWNEPDYPAFWTRSIAQWLELWRRSYNKFRADSQLSAVPIVGPSMAAQPTLDNQWWSQYMNFIVTNKVAPDSYTWHTLGDTSNANDDLQTNDATMKQFFANTGAPAKPYCINEYINSGNERVNSAEAWNIARLERYDTPGLRANWLSGSELHDTLAELVWRPNAQSPYQPNGAWQMYNYYAQNMTGSRLATTGSSDRVLDVFATVTSTNQVKILTGVRAQTGTWEIEVDNMSALGYPTSGQLTIQTWGFDDVGTRGVSNGPSDRGKYTHTYSGNLLRFPIYQTQQDANTAWAFEFVK